MGWQILVIALAALGLGGCDRAKAEIAGFGQFEIGKTTLEDGYACTPMGELTYCSNNPSPPLGGQRTSTDLYFRGGDPTSPLVEILVAVNACQPEPIATELVKQLGGPETPRDNVLVWRQKTATIVAQLPVEPGVCEMNILAPAETARLEQLTSGPSAQPAKPAEAPATPADVGSQPAAEPGTPTHPAKSATP